MSSPSQKSPLVASAPGGLDAATAESGRWFDEHVAPHGPVLRNYLRGRYPAVRDVDDVVQESFFRIWRAKARGPIQSAKSFLFQIARHIAVDLIRHDRASPIDAIGDLAGLPVSDSRPDAATSLTIQERLDLLSDALVALPDRCREVIFLRKIRGHSQRAVAEALGVSERTVENHVRSGLIRLRHFMARKGIKDFDLR